MKILQIASGDFFSTYGGGQVYVKNIVDEMIHQHKDLVVISFVSKSIRIKKRLYKGIDLYEVGKEGMDDLFALIQKIQPSVIHAHSHKAQTAQIGYSLHIPVIVTAHHGGIVCPAGTLMDCSDHTCMVPVSHKNCLRCVLRNTRTGLFWYPLMRLLPKKFYIRLGKWLLKLPFILFITPIGSAARQIIDKQEEWQTIAERCTKMIAPCHKIAEAMVRNGLSKDKVAVLSHGIPFPKDIKVLSFPTIQNGNIQFFYVGRICYVKGLHILLKAFHQLDAPCAELHLIGGAGNKAEERYEKKIRQQYESDSRIIWHGIITPDTVYDKIRNFHVAVTVPIYLEVFGLNIAEALAIGKPVLATRNGGAEMQIEESINGWLVPQNDVEALREKMQEILNTFHKYDTRLSTSTVVSIETHCKQLWEIYEQV